MAAMYYLQNYGMGYCGNAPYWWRQGGSGYTPRLDDAQQFIEKEADDIIRSTRGSHHWNKWPVEMIDAISHRAVDFQDLK